MSGQRSDSSGLWIPLALLAGAGTLAAAAAVLVGSGSRRTPAPVSPLPPLSPSIDWFGGASRSNIDALAFMFASENESASLLMWALQALAANNFARQLGRARKQITDIASMLQSGVDKGSGRRLYGLGWGPQYDKEKKIKRWAATAAGRTPLRVNWMKFEMAERLLLNRVNYTELRGKRGETMPPWPEWLQINSFLQYEGFGETVIRQAGPDGETDPEVVLSRWGSPRLVASVEGVRFYAPGGR